MLSARGLRAVGTLSPDSSSHFYISFTGGINLFLGPTLSPSYRLHCISAFPGNFLLSPAPWNYSARGLCVVWERKRTHSSRQQTPFLRGTTAFSCWTNSCSPRHANTGRARRNAANAAVTLLPRRACSRDRHRGCSPLLSAALCACLNALTVANAPAFSAGTTI